MRKKNEKIIIALFFFANITVLYAQHSYAIIYGLINFKDNEEYSSYNSLNDATAISISFYYSENWGITKDLEYCLKPGVMLAGIPNFWSAKLGNGVRYWVNDNLYFSSECNIDFHPLQAVRADSKYFTFTVGVSFAVRIKDALFVVPLFHVPIDGDYGLQSKTRYLVNWHFGLGFECNY